MFGVFAGGALSTLIGRQRPLNGRQRASNEQNKQAIHPSIDLYIDRIIDSDIVQSISLFMFARYHSSIPGGADQGASR